MEIIHRKDAVAAGLRTYYTGKLCKNGHINYRYVQSGACVDCIRDSHPVAPGRIADLNERTAYAASLTAHRNERAEAAQIERAALEERNAAKGALMRRRVFCYAHQWHQLKETVIALTRLHNQHLQDTDIVSAKAYGTDSMAVLNIHPDDFSLIDAVAYQFQQSADQDRIKDKLATTPGAIDAATASTILNGPHTNWYRTLDNTVYIYFKHGWYLQSSLDDAIANGLRPYATPADHSSFKGRSITRADTEGTIVFNGQHIEPTADLVLATNDPILTPRQQPDYILIRSNWYYAPEVLALMRGTVPLINARLPRYLP